MRDKDNDLVVVKANKLIQNYKYTLSKTEIRIVNMIISNINSPIYDEKLNVMSFNINDFCKMLGWENYGGADYKRLKMVLRGLSNKSSDYIDFGDHETIVRWIEKPIFYPNSGIVDLKLDDDLKPFLLQANGIIQAKLKFYFEMDSKYSMRLYELLKSWDGYEEYTCEIDELRASIDALQKSYCNFAKFRQAVLDISVEEINKYTDLKVSYTTKTRGRKVTHVVFEISKSNVLVNKQETNEEQKDKKDKKWPPENELTEDQKYIKRVNDEAFNGEFSFKTADYLVFIGKKVAQDRVMGSFIDPSINDKKIEYYAEKYKEMDMRAKSTVPEQRAKYLEKILKAEAADYLGFKIDSQDKSKYVPKNKFNNFEERPYDWDELEKQLLNAN